MLNICLVTHVNQEPEVAVSTCLCSPVIGGLLLGVYLRENENMSTEKFEHKCSEQLKVEQLKGSTADEWMLKVVSIQWDII